MGRARTGVPPGTAAVVVALVLRPGLWPTAVGQVVATAAPGWWRRPPHLPLPLPAWLGFRQECATGNRTGPLRPDEVVSWLEWCRAQPGNGRGPARRAR
ncbi:MAG: hypothetical protein ACRD0J_16115 [Acidimicrobiales bacterium]